MPASKPEFAPGIPLEREVKPLPAISKSTDWTLAIQEHDADKAGKHFDLRLVDPATRHAHSWALPGARLPEPGKSVLAVPQATHTADYALNFGKKKPEVIESGYGKGVVRMHTLTDVDVHHADPDAAEGETRLRFNIYKSTGPEDYAIVRLRNGNDLLVNKTLTRERLPHLPIGEKPKAKDTDVDKIDFENAHEVMMPKYDGAHTLLDISRPNKNLNLFSYREPKRHAAGLIEHTHKVPSLLALKAPADLKGTTFRAETIAVDEDGKAIPAKDIAGMLNATVPASRAKQKQMGAELKPVIFDVVRYKGKDVTNKPFAERYELARQAGERLGLTVAELAKTPEEKRTLLEAIRAGKHPMTTEGVVLRSAIDDGPAIKAKFRPDYDVHVRSVFEAKDKSGAGKGRAGGFEYSWAADGPVVGRIGTGLDHETARDMLANPDKYIGRVAKVEAEQKYPSGALGKPAFMEWHLDKGDITKVAGSRLRAAFALRELEKPMFEGGRTFEALLHGNPVGKLDLRHSLDIPAGELMVGGAYLDPSVRGLGLGRKMYGEVMRRLPGGRLTSGGSVSDDAQRVWEALRSTKGYDITPNPDSLLHTLPSGGTHRQMNIRVMNEEMGKRLAGEPYRKIAPNLYTGNIAPEALLGKTAGITAALSRVGLI
jgi:GNAT superfamily N-acetyltransferase